MEIVEFCGGEDKIALFLGLPGELYSQREIMQSRGDEEKLLRGTHFLNRYAALTSFLALENGKALGRCMLTEYPGDSTAYFGFFECVEDDAVADALIDAVEACAAARGHALLVGPLDVSIWIRYRFKVNLFQLRPYTGEPYNKPYYPGMFARRGYAVRESYVSNRYRKLPRTDYELPQYRARYEEFTARGYEIRSPRPGEWERCVREVYGLVTRLYAGFECYKPVTEEEFVGYLAGYRRIVDLSLIKLAYYKGRAVGFFMGVPNYHNLASRKIGPATVLELLVKRKRSPEYVLLYMGVEPEHRGLGKALTHSIMAELAGKRAASIGSLIRDGNPNYNYAEEVMEERYRYVLLEKRLADFGLSDGGPSEMA